MKSDTNSKVLPAREIALKALSAYRRDSKWPSAAIHGFPDIDRVHPREVALAMRIADGVMRNLMLCDYYAECFSSIAIKKLEPRILDILRLSIYQIIFLTRVPNSAAVSEGVALAAKYSNSRAAGFVNAVLRAVAQASVRDALPEITGSVERRLSVKYSHPEWLTAAFCDALGVTGAEELLSIHNVTDTPVTAQVNTLLAREDEVLSMLRAEGVDAVRHVWLDGCFEMRFQGRLDRLDVFKKGYIYIQDAAARLAVIAADPKPGEFLIDGCAAPGGKSIAAAIMMSNAGSITAFDINARKLRLLTESAERMRLSTICAVEQDAFSPLEDLVGEADVVIADAPCSGVGVIRKKPEIRYKSEGDVETLCRVQKDILSALALYVKPGGTLVYSTCSLLPRENEDVANSFLSSNSEFYTEGFSLPGVGDVRGGMVTLWPHIHGTDGFFICRMKRKLGDT